MKQLTSIRYICAGACIALSAFALSACGPSEPDIVGGQPDMRRLTDAQYHNIVTDIFGPQINIGGEADPLVRSEGLKALGTRNVRITPSGAQHYYLLGNSVARQVVSPANRNALIGCRPASVTAPDDTCARAFFAKVGRFLYRRPLTRAEIQTPVESAREMTIVAGDFYEGLAEGLTGMMIAPQFLYVIDTTEPDPDQPSRQRLTSFTKAARLSFFLWNSTPDNELLVAAEQGKLETKDGLDQHVKRMMSSHHLDMGVRAFFEDFLLFDQFETLAKDTIIYPAFNRTLAGDMKEQMLRTIVHHLIDGNQDYRDLFTTRKTFLTASLARVYRVPVAKVGGQWVPHEFSLDDPRAGLLSQVGFLALASHPGRSSPTLRGKAIRESMLCQKVPEPPGDVDFSIFEDPDMALKTSRERLEAHSTVPACAGCHRIMDPIGLGLENFDGVGQFRRMENGYHIDTSGDLDGIAYEDPAGLGLAMRSNPATTSCVVKQVSAYALGRPLTLDDNRYLEFLEESFARSGYRFGDLMQRIAMSEALYTISIPTESTSPQLSLDNARFDRENKL